MRNSAQRPCILCWIPVEGTRGSQAKEFCALQRRRVTIFPVSGRSAFTARPGARPESGSESLSTEQGPPYSLWSLGLSGKSTSGGPARSCLEWPRCAGPVSGAATVLLGALRSLLGRYRHTWDAKDSKLGGDVNGPGQTNSGISARVPSRDSGACYRGPRGGIGKKKKVTRHRLKHWRGRRRQRRRPSLSCLPLSLRAAVKPTARFCVVASVCCPLPQPLPGLEIPRPP